MRTIDMRLYQTPFNAPIVLGRQGESNVTKLNYDLSEIVEEYGEGNVEFVYKNPDFVQYVPSETSYDAERHIATWKPDKIDTGVAGDGCCEIRFYPENDENGVYKTFLFNTEVLHALGEAEPAPDPYEDILHKMQEIKAFVIELKDETFEARDEAVFASDRAQELASKLMYARMEKLRPYLYEVWYDMLDYNFANEFMKTKFPVNSVGCSVVRKDDFVGGKFDWFYNEDAQFVIHSHTKDGRYETLGITGSIAGMTDEFVQTHQYSDLYRIAPFMVEMCMNEFGLFIKTNVVPNEKGNNKVIEPDEYLQDRDFDEMCTLMIPRYLADNFKRAENAIEYLTTNVRVFHPQALLDMGYNQHFIIADQDSTYVLEFIEGHYVVIEEMEKPILTNFHVDGIELNSDGSVYTPQTKDNDHDAIRTNLISEHGSGLERFNLINERYDDLESVNNWKELLDDLNYTRSYLTSSDVSNPYWYTEFVKGSLNVASNTIDFNSVTIAAAQKFANRSRDPEDQNYGTWQSSHSFLCNLSDMTIYVKAQEDGQWYKFILGTSGNSGTMFHDELYNREKPNQHTIDAITNLREILDLKYSKPSTGIPKTDLAEAVIELLDLAATALQSETDPTIYEWAKQATKPSYTKSEIGLGNVDNTSDINKPISTATQNALDEKADEDDLDDVDERVTTIESKIPGQATSSNQLADKNFVNSSIATNTAHYIYKNVGGTKVPFSSVAELEAYSGTVTQNDYAFVTGTDEQGNAYYDRYKADIEGTTVTWAKEFRLNNSSFTAEQWASISSGITSGDVATIRAIVDNYYDKTIIDELLDDKQDVIDDLEDIREGAAAGFTALQDAPEDGQQYARRNGEWDVIEEGTEIDDDNISVETTWSSSKINSELDEKLDEVSSLDEQEFDLISYKNDDKIMLKKTNAENGNIAIFDEDGDAKDSGHDLSEYVSSQDPTSAERVIGGLRTNPNENRFALMDDLTVASQILNNTYPGIDLTVKFALEIANYSDEWAWIKARITTGNFTGIHVFDYIPVVANGSTFKSRILGINIYKNYGDIAVGNHIDWMFEELWPTRKPINPVNFNNGGYDGMAVIEYPWLFCDAYKYANSLAGRIPSVTGAAITEDNYETNTSEVDYTTDGIYYHLPQKLKNIIIEKRMLLPKRQSATSVLTTDNSWGWANAGKLWLPTESEVYGQAVWNTGGNANGGSALQYPYFAGNMKRVKKRSGSRDSWWLLSAYSGNSTIWCSVGYHGIANYYDTSGTYVALPVCFRT